MNPLPCIETDRLILRIAEDKDKDDILHFIIDNHDHFLPWEPIKNTHYFTLEYWKKSIIQDKNDYQNDLSLRLYLFIKPDRRLIGVIHFSNFVRGPFQSCFLGYKISKKYEGKGLMFEALQAAINFVFQELNLHRIEANYMPGNQRSANLLKRLRFQIFGEEDDYLRIAGKWEKHIRTSLINIRWKDKKDS